MRFFKTPVLSFLILFSLYVFGQTAATAQDQVSYFLGEVKMTSPTGQPFGTSVSLVMRTLKPSENKIVELVASIDPKQPTREYTTVFDIKGSKFLMKDLEGTFTGDGELVGEAWKWTGWKYSVNMLGERKGTLKGEDVIGSAGLNVKKSFLGTNGQVQALFVEDLRSISKEMYDVLHAKLVSK